MGGFKPFNMTELEEKKSEAGQALLEPTSNLEDVKIAIVEPKDVQEPQEGDQIQGKKAPRDQWSKDIEFLLASIGYCVGVGNIWRFPYLCFKNGGGAFLIPYFILIITGSFPMYYLEIIMGQYTRCGAIKIWDICPIFRGVGIGISIMNMFVNVYFIILMTWPMHFMFASLVPIFAPLFGSDVMPGGTRTNAGPPKIGPKPQKKESKT